MTPHLLWQTNDAAPESVTQDAYAAEILRCLRENGLTTDDESHTIHHYLVT